eukprot:12070507-Alexandrium_andersonii.AAC.1
MRRGAEERRRDNGATTEGDERGWRERRGRRRRAERRRQAHSSAPREREKPEGRPSAEPGRQR